MFVRRRASNFTLTPTNEAITLEEQLQEVQLPVSNADTESNRTVYLPHPFTYALMKLYAFRDQLDRKDKEFGSHHALDLYAVIAMMTEDHWRESQEMATRFGESEIVMEASQIVAAILSSKTSKGMLVMRANPYCTNDLHLEDFVKLLGELFCV